MRLVNKGYLPVEVERPVTCDHTIGLDIFQADRLGNYAAVVPGDTVCIEAGTRSVLQLRSFQGEVGKPILFINSGGTVVIQGNGNNQIYNNVIIRPGRLDADRGVGIIARRGSNNGQSVFIWNNTIVEPPQHGILFRNDQRTDNRIQNNLIVSLGNLVSERDDAYIDTKDLTNVVVSNNLFKQSVGEVGFVNPGIDDYSLLPNSPAIDVGVDLTRDGVITDYLGVERSYGQGPDIGAFEYVPNSMAP